MFFIPVAVANKEGEVAVRAEDRELRKAKIVMTDKKKTRKKIDNY